MGMIEWQKDNKQIIVNDTEVKHTVYIYKCEGSVVQVNGKVNNVVLDSCKKTAVVFESAISACEIVNCQSVQVQCKTTVPSYAIDKTDGALVYVSKEGLASEFITSKSSELNI